MKRKRTKGISCERARNVCIVNTMAKLGHFPYKSTEKEAWFLSPFRSETQASFKACKKINRWYDHGAGKGGNVIDLVCEITNTSVSEALKFLDMEQISFSIQQQGFLKNENQRNIKILKTMEIGHFALKEYLRTRKISVSVASSYCKEVHYGFKDKTYYAIGLQNKSGGWELRNKYVKNSSSPKDITLIQNGSEKLIITEGMFDLLSWLSYNEKLELDHDFMVLNSTAFVQRGLKIIGNYNQVELYLDNDKSGRHTAQKFLKHSNVCRDMSSLYTGFSDVNEWLKNRGELSNEHGIQDVSLLPQRQSCFAPDGRKVEKR